MSTLVRGCIVILLLVTGCKPPQDKPVQWFRADGTINWEAEKQPTDAIVIHHTADAPGMTWQRLSDIQRERLYVPRFKPSIPDPFIPAGTRVQSGHFRDEPHNIAKTGEHVAIVTDKTEVFYAYHWLIRSDGKAERLLKDEDVGWHCGNWTMNCRSIAICFDDNLVGKKPTDAAMKTCARLLAMYRKKFKIKEIVGHNDVKSSTECPGEWFKDGGRDQLLKLADSVKPFSEKAPL